MKTQMTVLALMVASILAVMTAGLQQQASAGVIILQKEEFSKLSEQFQRDVLDLVAGGPPSEADPPSEDRAVDPPDPDKLAVLFDNYQQETFRIFELEPPDPDAQPPDPDVEPPTPDKS